MAAAAALDVVDFIASFKLASAFAAFSSTRRFVDVDDDDDDDNDCLILSEFLRNLLTLLRKLPPLSSL